MPGEPGRRAANAILRAGGKRRFHPETLGAGGRRRELQGGRCSPSPHFCLPPAPPCSPCICGSKHGAGYCLKELAEFPVLLDGGREAGEGQGLRACWGKGQPVVPVPRLGCSSFPLLFSPTPWQGGVGDEGEADGVWELWVCLTSGTGLPGPGRETGVLASRAGQCRRRAGVVGRGRA